MNTITPEEPQRSSPDWYFSKEEIEKHSPSRKDGIDVKKELQLQRLYCSFLRELGIKLKVPQVTIAAAMVLCHRFYVRQSHMRNDWQTIATVSMFLACKVEDTPRFLRDLVIVAYELMYKWDPSASQRIRLKEVYEQQKELILIGERLLLATIAFDVNIQLPYKPLVAALKNLGLHSELSKIAWNFVNDWLCTTMCLQYKPHYIAAGCVYLAAKFQNMKLPTSNEKVWWMEFDISPKKLEEVIQQMLSILGQDRKQASCLKDKKLNYTAPVAAQAMHSSQQSCVTSWSSSSSNDHKIDAIGTHKSKVPDSSNNGKFTLSRSTEDVGLACQISSASSGSHESRVPDSSNNGKYTLNGSTEDFRLTCEESIASSGTHESKVPDCSSNVKGTLNSSVENVGLTCQTTSSSSGISTVEENNSIVQPKIGQGQSLSTKSGFINGIDISRIKDLRRKQRGVTSNNPLENLNFEIGSEAWVEREIEMGILVEDFPFAKKQRKEPLSILSL